MLKRGTLKYFESGQTINEGAHVYGPDVDEIHELVRARVIDA